MENESEKVLPILGSYWHSIESEHIVHVTDIKNGFIYFDVIPITITNDSDVYNTYSNHTFFKFYAGTLIIKDEV